MAQLTQDQIRHKINSLLFKIATTEDQLDPTDDQSEEAQSIMVEMIKAHGFDHREASRVVRSIFWSGWNAGWSRGWESREQARKAQER